VQASVHSFDDQTGAGSVLLDDGRRVSFGADVFGASGLRRLRPGQRVTVELSGSSPLTVRRLGIRGVPTS
jgi:cold shock CspA family protein